MEKSSEKIYCKVHDLPVNIEIVDVMTGIIPTLLKRMVVGYCSKDNCKEWCEISNNMVLWA